MVVACCRNRLDPTIGTSLVKSGTNCTGKGQRGLVSSWVVVHRVIDVKIVVYRGFEAWFDRVGTNGTSKSPLINGFETEDRRFDVMIVFL